MIVSTIGSAGGLLRSCTHLCRVCCAGADDGGASRELVSPGSVGDSVGKFVHIDRKNSDILIPNIGEIFFFMYRIRFIK